ncbi:acyltransferase [Brachybacterium endophyticum]|nr:acyltransferase [Brachybacterium endophyticum]
MPYDDVRGNSIDYDGDLPETAKVTIKLRGSGNRLVVARDAKIVDLMVDFSGDDAVVVIEGTTESRTGLRFSMRLGHECTVRIGENVGTETKSFIRVSEGQSVTIGEDCMIASGVAFRADDSHAIYDVRTGKRSNPAGCIDVGEHVWLGKDVVVMGGVTIGQGSVVGLRGIVTKDLPNNCVAAGAPARVVKRDVAWERPILSFREPGIPGLPRGHKKSTKYWNVTRADGD